MNIGIVQAYGSKSGGAAYEQMVTTALREDMNVDPLQLRRRSWLPGYFANMALNGKQMSLEPDVLILTVNATSFLDWKRHRNQKKVIIWHHHDPEAFSGGKPMLKQVYRLLFDRILAHADEVDLLVVVGEYWRSFFAKYNFKKIEVIYNAFSDELMGYEPSGPSRDAVRGSLNVGDDQALVYIGQFQKMKGAHQVYTALKERKDLVLVGSGRKDIELPIQHFEGTYPEYLQMLSACDVALSMSRMYEGWNRTAHEAMLTGTPVIGNAIGNSGELLSGASQLICQSYCDLPISIDAVLTDREHYSMRAREYVRLPMFRESFFSDRWQGVVKELLQ